MTRSRRAVCTPVDIWPVGVQSATVARGIGPPRRSPAIRSEKGPTIARDKISLLPLALSPTHAAQALGVRPALVYAAVKSGKLPVYRPSGTKRKILVCDLIEWYRTEWERVS